MDLQHLINPAERKESRLRTEGGALWSCSLDFTTSVEITEEHKVYSLMKKDSTGEDSTDVCAKKTMCVLYEEMCFVKGSIVRTEV